LILIDYDRKVAEDAIDEQLLPVLIVVEAEVTPWSYQDKFVTTL
jgi:hypothetical protein